MKAIEVRFDDIGITGGHLILVPDADVDEVMDRLTRECGKDWVVEIRETSTVEEVLAYVRDIEGEGDSEEPAAESDKPEECV